MATSGKTVIIAAEYRARLRLIGPNAARQSRRVQIKTRPDYIHASVETHADPLKPEKLAFSRHGATMTRFYHPMDTQRNAGLSNTGDNHEL